MRRINKGVAPRELGQWRAANRTGTYRDLGLAERNAIRTACLTEQLFLCAYCCAELTGEGDCMNEHVEPRSVSPERELDFNNIVASCRTARQCDASHGAQILPITPFMEECESQLSFSISGRVAGLSVAAVQTINILNLGDSEVRNRALIEKRKMFSHCLLLSNGIDPSSGLDDDDLLQMVIEDLERPTEGRLQAYAPVVASILRSWIS